MTSVASTCCHEENLCHAAKGTGYLLGASGAALTLSILAATVTAVALCFLAWDGLFVYSVGIQAPLNLLWAIPVTLAFISVDLFIILNVTRVGAVIGNALLRCILYCGDKMVEHFSRIG